MEKKDDAKVILTTQDGSKQLHITSNSERSATVIIPTNPKDIVKDSRDDNNIFEFMTVDQLEEHIRNAIDYNLNMDKPVITSPTNGTRNWNGGVKIGRYRVPNVPNDRTVTTVYQFSTTETFTDIVCEVVRKGSNISNIISSDLLDSGIVGGSSNLYHVRVKILVNSLVSPWSDSVSFTYVPSSYAKPRIRKMKFMHQGYKRKGTAIEKAVRSAQPLSGLESMEERRPLSSFEEAPSLRIAGLPTADYLDTNIFKTPNGFMNFVFHCLGVYNKEYRTIENIPSFRFSHRDIISRLDRRYQGTSVYEFITTGTFTAPVFRFLCEYKSGLLTPKRHVHGIVNVDIDSKLEKNSSLKLIAKTTEKQDECTMQAIDQNIDLNTLFEGDIAIVRISRISNKEDGDRHEDTTYFDPMGDDIYFINKKKPFNPKAFEGFTFFDISHPLTTNNPEYPTQHGPSKLSILHVERDAFSDRHFLASIEMNTSLEGIVWNDTISGTVGTEGTVTPPEEETPVDPDNPTDGDDPNVDDEHPYYSSYVDGVSILTGEVDMYVTPATSQYGDPGVPNILEIKYELLDGSGLVYLKELEYEKNISLITQRLIPLELFPGVNYSVSIRYKNTANDKTSPWSDPRRFEVPKSRLFPIDLNIAGKANGVLTNNPTIGITDLLSHYDYLNLLFIEPKSFNKEEIGFIPYYSRLEDDRNGVLSYNFSIDTATTPSRPITTASVEKQVKDISNYLFKGVMHTIDTNKSGVTINASTQYLISCEIFVSNLHGEEGRGNLIGNRVENKIQTSANSMVIPTDRLDNPIATLGKIRYYGDILTNNLMPNMKFRGEYALGVNYKRYDEVVYITGEGNGRREQLYLCLSNHVSNTDQPGSNFVAINLNNYKDYYKSGLPSYKWLADKIGLPLLASNRVMPNGEIKRELYCSNILQDGGWIKVQNKLNNILYIAKKPMVSKIPYEELRKRFLTGHNTRTIRIGLNYYNVRLLETNPTEFYDEHYIDSDDANEHNELMEFKLFEAFFNRNFINTTLGDIGLVNNKNQMFVNGGKINATYFNSTITVTPSPLKEEEKTLTDNFYYYRPVLELVKEDHLPYRLMKTDLPGEQNLEYDKWTDTGYFGVIDGSELLTPEEMKNMFNLTELTMTKQDIFFHKFYYHGMVLYIPNRPVANMEDNPILTLSYLAQKGLMYGDKFYSGNYIKGNRFGIMTLEMSPNHLEPIFRDELHSESMLIQLLGRIDPSLNRLNPNIKLRPFVTDLHESLRGIDVNNVIFKNIEANDVDTDRFTVHSDESGIAITREAVIMPGSYLPVIAMEAFDHSRTIHYDEVTYGTPVITYKSVTYTPTVLKEKRVVRKVPVKKTILQEQQVLVQIKKEEPTGSTIYKTFEKSKNDHFGLFIGHVSKTSLAGSMKTLYGREMLNISLLNGEPVINYSFGEKGLFKNISDYICKSVIAKTTDPLLADYIAITKTFPGATVAKNYMRSLIREDVDMISLSNQAFKYPNTSEDRKFPLGMIMGCLSSRIAWFPKPRWFDIVDPALGLDMRMNLSPNIVISENEGVRVFKNSWNKLNDKNGNLITIPLLSPFIPYDKYSDTGKELLQLYMEYVIRQTRPDITREELDHEVNLFYKDNDFGIVCCDFDNLCGLRRSGIVGNGYSVPVVAPFEEDFTMDRYFPYNGEGTLNENLKDIFNPIQETKVWYEPGYVTEYIAKEYTELEEREFVEYIQVPGEPVTIQVPVIEYRVLN